MITRRVPLSNRHNVAGLGPGAGLSLGGGLEVRGEDPRSVSGCFGLVPFHIVWLVMKVCDEIQMVDFEMLSSDELRSYFSIVRVLSQCCMSYVCDLISCVRTQGHQIFYFTDLQLVMFEVIITQLKVSQLTKFLQSKSMIGDLGPLRPKVAEPVSKVQTVQGVEGSRPRRLSSADTVTKVGAKEGISRNLENILQ